MPQVSEFSWKMAGLKVYLLFVSSIILLTLLNTNFTKEKGLSWSFFAFLSL